ncbi:MAG TPA: hypothetical protein VGO62_07770, partial [Myxococcota bacterium]
MHPALALITSTIATTTPSTPSSSPSPSSSSVSVPLSSASFVLVVGNNKSQSDARPDLRYADDDALQYGALYARTTARERVIVLTSKDADTARSTLAPVNGPATRAMVTAAAAELQAQVQRARAAGEATSFTFVFAGHGEIDHGKGVLDLEDARLLPSDLKIVLDTVGADVTPVLLDSCNSFFVMYPRRPGGKVVATAADTTAGIALAHGDVGVFLSTSAEAQVFEWSQLESGIFSHVVRSGLSGAADANGDGLITYGELRAFVSIATRGLADSAYRPHLFVKGPSARGDDDVFLDLRHASGPRVKQQGLHGLVTVRDSKGRRLVDVRTEPGFAPTLVALPVEDGDGLEIIAEEPGDDGRTRLKATAIDAAALLSSEGAQPIAAVTPAALSSTGAARGTDEALAHLFDAPFGPHAVDDERARTAAEAPEVYGITREQEARLASELAVYAEQARDWRLGLSTALICMGAAAGVYWAVEIATLASSPEQLAGNIQIAAGAALGTAALPVAVGVLSLFRPALEERLVATFDEAPQATERERLLRAANTIDDIDARAREYESDKTLT